VDAPQLGLRVAISVAETHIASATDLVVHVTLTNTLPDPIRYRTWFLAPASLHLKVRNIDGTPQFPGPPPTPAVDDGSARKTIAAGDSMSLTYLGSDFFQSTPAPGMYEVQFTDAGPRDDRHGATIESGWVRFEIRR
jgi:hypothetical protein